MFSTVRCARMASPTGGPRDSLAPVVVRTTPQPYTTNFKGKKVLIEFNEYVKFKDQQKLFFVSPPSIKKPQLTIKGKSVEVAFEENLEPETTYRLDFGSSIVDNNEGNPLYGYSFVFSTGDVVDSLVMAGQVIGAYERDSVLGAFLFYYDAKIDSTAVDSTIFNGKVDALFRTDSSGYFVADILKDKKYRIYALDDTNGDQRYQPGTDRIGFIEGTFNPAELGGFTMTYDSVKRFMTIDSLQAKFEVFKEIPLRRQSISKQERPLRQKIVLSFNTKDPKIDSIQLEGIDKSWLIPEYGIVGDTVTLWIAPPTKELIGELVDTIRGTMLLERQDSVWNPYQSKEKLTFTHRIFQTKEKKREEHQQAREKTKKQKRKNPIQQPSANINDTIIKAEPPKDTVVNKDKKPVANPFRFKVEAETPLIPTKNIAFTFDYPLTKIDSSRIELFHIVAAEQKGRKTEAKTTSTEVRIPFHLRQSPGSIRRWVLSADWKADNEYRLMIPSGVFEDIAFEKNDTLKSQFKIANSEKFGKLILSTLADSTDKSHYIFELLQRRGNDYNIVERVKAVQAGDEITIPYLKSGNYLLRIVQDANHNGKWDTGSITLRRHPEKVRMLLDDSQEAKQLISKENWDIGESLNLKKIFE